MRSLSTRLVLAAIGATLSLGIAGCGGGDSSPATSVLRFTAIPDDNTTELRAKFGPVAAHLSEALGVPVEYVPSIDYGASVEMFKNGDVHLAWFGGLTGVQARQAVPGARAIAQGVEDPRYFSYFIANASTGLERGDDFPIAIAAHRFTFGSSMSTSGRLMPEHFLRLATGKSPREFFAHDYGFSGSHDQTIAQVASGAYDVGACNYRTYDALVAEGKIDPAECRIIWKTPEYADYNFTAHPDLEARFGAGFVDRLQAVLVAIDDPKLLAAFRRSGLVRAENAEFAAILDVARSLDMAR